MCCPGLRVHLWLQNRDNTPRSSVYIWRGDAVFSQISHHLLSVPFFLTVFTSLLILVTRGLHREFLSLTILLASALGEACHVLWLMGRQEGQGEMDQTVEPCRSTPLRSFLHHSPALGSQGNCFKSLSLNLLVYNTTCCHLLLLMRWNTLAWVETLAPLGSEFLGTGIDPGNQR